MASSAQAATTAPDVDAMLEDFLGEGFEVVGLPDVEILSRAFTEAELRTIERALEVGQGAPLLAAAKATRDQRRRLVDEALELVRSKL